VSDQLSRTVSLPAGWTKNIKSAILQAISLAHFATTYARGWAANSINARVRLATDNDRRQHETELLCEELRIKNARIAKISPRQRPYYPPTERMAILELKAARGWSLAQTARALLVEPDTIAAWMKRIDQDGPSALVQPREPVNKFPDFVRHIVVRLKTLCPSLGKVKIAQMLARAGLHLCATTVGRMLKAKTPTPKLTETPARQVVPGEGARAARHTPAPRGGLSPRTQASADRHAQTSGVAVRPARLRARRAPLRARSAEPLRRRGEQQLRLSAPRYSIARSRRSAALTGCGNHRREPARKSVVQQSTPDCCSDSQRTARTIGWPATHPRHQGDGFRGEIGTPQKVSAAMPFSPYRRLSTLHDALSR